MAVRADRHARRQKALSALRREFATVWDKSGERAATALLTGKKAASPQTLDLTMQAFNSIRYTAYHNSV